MVRLTEHQAEIGKVSMRSLFESNPQRYPEFTLSAAGFMLDYSKNRITPPPCIYYSNWRKSVT